MAFFFIALIGMFIGRLIGWFISKKILFFSPLTICMILCFLWGILIAYLIHYLVQWQHPNIVLKIIMGYCLGGYVAMPNYGLDAGPQSEKLRHNLILIDVIPLVTYAIVSIIFALI